MHKFGTKFLTLLKLILYLRKDYLFTLIIGFSSLAGQFLAIRLASIFLGTAGVALFLIGRRMISLLEPLTSLGMGVTLPKYIARSGSKEIADTYWVTGSIIMLLSSIVIILFVNILAPQCSLLFFGASGQIYLILPLTVTLFGLATVNICYAYFQGNQRFYAANSIRFLQMAFIPIVSFFLIKEKSVVSVWYMTGILLIIMSVVTIKSFMHIRPLPLLVKQQGKELFLFGSKRMLANLIAMAFLTLPITFTAHKSGLKQAGAIALSITILNSIGYSFSLLNIILLPRISEVVAKKEIYNKIKLIKLLLIGVILLSSLMVVFVEIFAPLIVKLFLATSENHITQTIRWMIPGAIPYAVYLGLRGIIDARHKKVVITIYMGIAFIIFLFGVGLTYLFGGNSIYIIVSFVCGLFILGGLIVFDILYMIFAARKTSKKIKIINYQI